MPLVRRLPRPTYANVTSTLALFLALGGGAYAATGGFVSRDGTVRLCVARNGSVNVARTSRRCRRGTTTVTINQKGLTGSRGPAGLKGATGAAGLSSGNAGGDLAGKYPNPSIGDGRVVNSKLGEGAVTNGKLANESVSSAKIQTGQVRAANVAPILEVSNSLSVEKELSGTVEVQCPGGTRAISGGFESEPRLAAAAGSKRVANGWEVSAKNTSATSSIVLKAIAYCLEG